MSKRKTLIISVLILAAAVVVTFIVFVTEPEAQREGATRQSAMLVDVVRVKRGDYRPTVVATGAVQAAKDILLSPQVGGEVVRISENFIPGSFVEKGEVLVQINPADYSNTLQLRQSELALAKSDLSIEMGRQDVARKDFELIGQEMSEENQALVLRKPQLEAAKANVSAAEAAVAQARLALRRTTIRAPFDAHIISRNVNEGSQLAPGTEIGRLVGMEEYWVVANVPTGKVSWLSFSDNTRETRVSTRDSGENGATGSRRASDVKIVNNGWMPGQFREGRLFRLVGALDNQTRLARVIISVSDPLVRNTEADSLPPLMIGTFVEAQIEAREIPEVVRLNRDYLRQGSTVWVMREGKLEIRQVDIVFQDADYAYIREGLADNEMVVTTDLSTVVEGADLRIESETAVSERQDQADNEE